MVSERPGGVEPPFVPWEGTVRPFNYGRMATLYQIGPTLFTLP